MSQQVTTGHNMSQQSIHDWTQYPVLSFQTCHRPFWQSDWRGRHGDWRGCFQLPNMSMLDMCVYVMYVPEGFFVTW